MPKIVPLSTLQAGDKGIIVRINGSGITRRRLLDMGVVKRTEIEVIRTAPLGDPIELTLKGYNLTLRKVEADKVYVSLAKKAEEAK